MLLSVLHLADASKYNYLYYYLDEAYYFRVCPIIYARQVVVFSVLDEEIK